MNMARVLGKSAFDCMAACAAMLAGVDLATVFQEVGHDGIEAGGFRFTEITRFLAGREIHLGLPWQPLFPGHLPVQPSVRWNCHDTALVIVRGQRQGTNHAIVLHHGQVLDPSPAMPDHPPLSGYEIMQWWPAVEMIVHPVKGKYSGGD